MAVADGGRAAARGDRLVKLILAWGSARSQCSDTPVTEHQPEQALHWYLDSPSYRCMIIVLACRGPCSYTTMGFRGFLLDGLRPALHARRRTS